MKSALPNRPLEAFYSTKLGSIYAADSLKVMKSMEASSVDLVVTSPPFGLTRKKEYGNMREGEYLEWFRAFASEFLRILKDSGSLVIDIGGAWKPGVPVRSLYHFKLLIMLCDEFEFHLAQDFYWWNPSKLPAPAEWVNIRRIRVKDAINPVWWLSKTEWPRASNRRVLQPYSPSMETLLANGYKAKLRPSGHDISSKFSINNGAAIPSNLLAIPNTESNSAYMRYCQEKNIKAHPARFPADLPEYFIRMLTDPGDSVIDPFAGSCMTGEIAERLGRRWTCVELVKDYLEGALGRFEGTPTSRRPAARGDECYYKIPRPSLLWNGANSSPLDPAGGSKRLKAKLRPSPLRDGAGPSSFDLDRGGKRPEPKLRQSLSGDGAASLPDPAGGSKRLKAKLHPSTLRDGADPSSLDPGRGGKRPELKFRQSLLWDGAASLPNPTGGEKRPESKLMMTEDGETH